MDLNRPDLDAGRALSRPNRLGPLDFGLGRRIRSLLDAARPDRAGDPVAELVRTHRSIHPYTDAVVLRRAYAIAEHAHRGQLRKSGEPFITHPLAVGQILAGLGMDTTTLVAALLHDTVEDTEYTLQALQADFGPEVAHLVDGVTKFDKVFYGKAAEVETLRKLIVAAGRDVRVLIIKLADRLHNMRTLDARSPASRARIAKATEEVLVPLSDRLGIQALKRDIEDAVLFHLAPEEYGRIDAHVREQGHWATYLASMIEQTRTALRPHRINAEIRPRPRHHYSIWKDTIAAGHDRPHDMPRVAMIVEGSEADCYAALGALHACWRPIPGRFKDFIASPKHNLYRSLHTTVLGPESRTVEVLIRTTAMHRTAEYGIAANFRYPNPADRDEEQLRDPLAWLRRVLDWEQETTDPAQFLASLRCDLAEAQIKVFARGGAVLLPERATPVDVAYELGPDVGDTLLAATVNGRLAPLSSALSDGDVVEVFTERDGPVERQGSPRGPRREWLEFVRSPHAQRQIRRWFVEPDAGAAVGIADKVRLGRSALWLALRRHDRNLVNESPLRQLAESLGYPDHDTLLVAIADKSRSADEVAEKLISMVDHHPG
ncbi:RelA/SpoT family protein [Pilimelia columellifera]